jgi:uncharacterized repeat protein (TIGR03809 family)
MPAGQGKPPFDDLARRWHHLADRRLAHFAELYHSGRWRHYYRTEAQFAERMLDVIKAAKIWAELAGHEPPTVTVPVSTMTASPETVPARAELATASKPAGTSNGKSNGLRPAA